MFEVFATNPAAAIVGLLALICLSIWPLFGTRTAILLVQLAAGLGFAAYYFMLGILTPSLVTVLGSVQTVAALLAPCSKILHKFGYALIPLMAAAGIYFWTGPVSTLCVAGMALIAFGRMQRNQLELRGLILGGGALWAVYDFLVGLWIVLAADILSLVIGFAALAMMIRRDPGLIAGLIAYLRGAARKAAALSGYKGATSRSARPAHHCVRCVA